MAVLAVLEHKDRYGLEILDVVSTRADLGIAGGTLYPLLNRLQREGKVTSQWREDADASHPRKYYMLTENGKRLLHAMKAEWRQLSAGLDGLCVETPPP